MSCWMFVCVLVNSTRRKIELQLNEEDESYIPVARYVQNGANI